GQQRRERRHGRHGLVHFTPYLGRYRDLRRLVGPERRESAVKERLRERRSLCRIRTLVGQRRLARSTKPITAATARYCAGGTSAPSWRAPCSARASGGLRT